MERSEDTSIVKQAMLASPELDASLVSAVRLGPDRFDKEHALSEDSNDDDDNDDDNNESVAFLEEIFQARCRDLGIAASERAYRRFEDVLERTLTGSTFSLQQNGIGSESAACIARWLSEDDTFTKLDLAKNSIGDSGATSIARLVQVNPYLTDLDLRSNVIGPTGFVELANGLRSNNSIISLDLSSETGFHKNICGERGAVALADFVKRNDTLQTLRLGNIGGLGLKTLALNGLRHSQSIRVLDLRLNHIGDEAIGSVLVPLGHSLIEELNLQRNLLSDMSTPAIVTLLETSSTLRSLDLSWNSFSKPFCTSLMASLEKQITLEHLFLDGNMKIGAQKGLNPIFEGLMNNKTMKTLSIAKCHLKDCNLLARLVKHTTALQKLVLNNNLIGDEDCTSLATSLSSNQSLVHLDLSCNSIGDKAGMILAKSLDSNSNLHELLLKDNKLTDETANMMLNVVRKQNSTLSRLTLQLNGISMKIWFAIEEALRNNKANVRAAKIISYHREVEVLQQQERELRERVQHIRRQLFRQSPEQAFAEVKRASDGLGGFKEDEANKTQSMKEVNDAVSVNLRSRIKELNEELEQTESEHRHLYRASIQTTHKLEMKIAGEQRRKASAFRNLRTSQKVLNEKQLKTRSENLAVDALMKELKDEEDAREWMEEAVHKWSKKMARLSAEVLDDYENGIKTYLETLIPAPTKTSRIKQRWQKVTERRQQLLTNFNADAFLQWFLDPTRPEPILNPTDDNSKRGFALHFKVATSADMIAPSICKLVHASHSVHSMSVHGLARLSTIFVGLHDHKLALEFKSFRADVSHVVIRVPGHTKMDELKSQVAEKIGVDESDISGLYHLIERGSDGVGDRSRRADKRRQHKLCKDEDEDASDASMSPDSGLVLTETEDMLDSDHERDQDNSEVPEKIRTTVPKSRSKAKKKNCKSAQHECQVHKAPITSKENSRPRPKSAASRATPAGTALKQVQQLFPCPNSDSSENGDTDILSDGDDVHNDSDNYRSKRGSYLDESTLLNSISPPRATFMKRRVSTPAFATEADADADADADGPTNGNDAAVAERSCESVRRSSAPNDLVCGNARSTVARRKFTQLMSWNLHHSQRRFQPKASASPRQRARTMREANPNIELDPDVADSPMEMWNVGDVDDSGQDKRRQLQLELQQSEKSLGDMHPAVSTTLVFLGAQYVEEKEYDEAEKVYARAQTIREKAFGRRHPHVATVLHSLADLYTRQGRFAEAEPLYIRAIRVREKTLGKQNPVLAESLMSLGKMYQARRDYDLAEPLYIRALTIREKIYGKRHLQVLESLQDISKLYADRGQDAQQGVGAAKEDRTSEVDTAIPTMESSDYADNQLQVRVQLDQTQDQWKRASRDTNEMWQVEQDHKALNEPRRASASVDNTLLRSTFRSVRKSSIGPAPSFNYHHTPIHKPETRRGSLPPSLQTLGTSTAVSDEVDSFDFRDAVSSVSVPSHWITRRRIMRVKPWNKLSSASKTALPRVQLQSQQLCLNLDHSPRH